MNTRSNRSYSNLYRSSFATNSNKFTKYNQPAWKKSVVSWVDQNNTFSFQILGILILTFGLFLSFGVITDSGSVSAMDDDIYVSSSFRNAINNPESTGQISLQEVFVFDESAEEVITVPIEDTVDFYKVATGESLYYICQKLSVNCEMVKDLNNFESPYALSVGQRIMVPKK